MGPVPGPKVPLLFKATSEIAIASARCASYKVTKTISRQTFSIFNEMKCDSVLTVFFVVAFFYVY